MKTSSFLTGIAVGVMGALAVIKKIKPSVFCSCSTDDENPAIKDAESAVETFRNSVDTLRKELNTRIESEQTYAAKCEDLKDEVAKKDNEISNLKNLCEKQAGLNKKLEEELSEAKSN
ncbi:MAG: hypothetical protein HUK20_02285 [Fibrobacter sp.]|nr:hypothetical protein [Fibrobacter sp.]